MSDKENIKKILHIENIQDYHIPFIYTNRHEFCCNIDLVPMFEDIKDYDYLEPIKRLAKYYSNHNYYQKLLEQIDNYFLTKEYTLNEHIYIEQHHHLFDEVLLQYVKCFRTMSAMIIWPIAQIDNIYETEFYQELLQNGIIHGIKEMLLTNKQVRNVIYQIYYDKDGFKKMDIIRRKQERSKATDKLNKIFIIFYKAHNFNEIIGKNAPLKNKLRKTLSKNDIPNYYLHVTDNHTQCVEMAQLFCNKNSMQLTYHQRLDRILENEFYRGQVMLMSIKKWLYEEIHPIDHIRFLFTSSLILFSLGLRNANDLDMFALDFPEKSETKDFMKKVDKYLENDQTKFPFADILMRNKGKCLLNKYDHLCKWYLDAWHNHFGSESIEETILNPRFHYYYFGIKFICIKADIKNRINRTRPAAYADLIAFKTFINEKQMIPHLPKGYWQQQVYYDITDEYVNVLYNKIKWYLKKRYGLNFSIEEIKKIIKKK